MKPDEPDREFKIGDHVTCSRFPKLGLAVIDHLNYAGPVLLFSNGQLMCCPEHTLTKEVPE